MQIVDTLFRSIFFGLTAWTICWSLTKREAMVGHSVEEVDVFVVRTAAVFGIAHMLILLSGFLDSGEGTNASLLDRAFGKYWFGFWMYPFVYFGLTQLLWLETLRKRKPLRVLIALCVAIVMHFEFFVIFTTSLHRDFSPDNGNQFPFYLLQQLGVNWLTAAFIFAVVVALGLKIKRRIQPAS